MSFTLLAPAKPVEPIDGTTKAFEADHPDATGLFAGEAGGDDQGEDGGDPGDLERQFDAALTAQPATTEKTSRRKRGAAMAGVE